MLQMEGSTHTGYLLEVRMPQQMYQLKSQSVMESNEWCSMSQQYNVVTLESSRVQVKSHPSC